MRPNFFSRRWLSAAFLKDVLSRKCTETNANWVNWSGKLQIGRYCSQPIESFQTHLIRLILNDILWVVLIDIKDNKHRWLRLVIHTWVIIAGIKSIWRFLRRRSSIAGVTHYIRTCKDFGQEHEPRLVGICLRVPMAKGCIHCKVASMTIWSTVCTAA